MAWWFDEDLASTNLLGGGCGNYLQLRAFSKRKRKTCKLVHMTTLLAPPERRNFIALRSEVHGGNIYLTIQTNDKRFRINNPDLFPVQTAGVKSRICFACRPKIRLPG